MATQETQNAQSASVATPASDGDRLSLSFATPVEREDEFAAFNRLSALFILGRAWALR